MANRHLLRSIVLQTLFEWDFKGLSEKESLEILKYNMDEFAEGVADEGFTKNLLQHILQKQADIDEVITKAAPDWPLEKISTVDRNILRIGLYELLFSDRSEVPAKVAINEAIELAKSFGGDTSGKFVNGVLGAVYKELGEPGKEETSKKKKEVPYEEMEIENLGGAVVYAIEDGHVFFALVHDIFGHWTLSKGKTEEGETVEEGTVREMKEELGLDVELKEILGDNEYVANHPEKGKYRKHVTYFLAEAPYVELTLGPSGGLDDAKWWKLEEITELNFYNDIMPIVTKAVTILSKQLEK